MPSDGNSLMAIIRGISTPVRMNLPIGSQMLGRRRGYLLHRAFDLTR